MAIRNFSDTAPPQALTTALTSSSSNTAVVVGSTSNYPAPPFILGAERGTINQEVMLCTSVTNITTFAVVRGYDNTPVVAHNVGATIEHTSAAIDYREANAFVNTITTKGDLLVMGNSGALRQAIGSDGTFLEANSTQATGMSWAQPVPAGTVMWFAGSVIPNGYLICDGQAISRTVYAALFATLGTVHGRGDFATTFNIPDIRSRSIMHCGDGHEEGRSFRFLGEFCGEEEHVLTENEMPPHIHNTPDNMPLWNADSSLFVNTFQNGGIPLRTGPNELTGPAGAGFPHNVIHPCYVLNAIIKY